MIRWKINDTKTQLLYFNCILLTTFVISIHQIIFKYFFITLVKSWDIIRILNFSPKKYISQLMFFSNIPTTGYGLMQ